MSFSTKRCVSIKKTVWPANGSPSFLEIPAPFLLRFAGYLIHFIVTPIYFNDACKPVLRTWRINMLMVDPEPQANYKTVKLLEKLEKMNMFVCISVILKLCGVFAIMWQFNDWRGYSSCLYCRGQRSSCNSFVALRGFCTASSQRLHFGQISEDNSAF